MINTTGHIGKTSLLLMLVWVGFVSLYAVGFIPADGNNISSGFQLQRDREFYYHTYKDEQHWYGTEKWAVRFDFTEEYPTYELSAFDINRIRIYFPVVSSPAYEVTVQVFSDQNNLPGNVLATVSQEVTSSWMEFSLPDIAAQNVVWVVLNCPTAVDGPYVSASRGGGNHSYYWNTNTPVQYYQNLYTAGIYSEFLISVVGRFDLSSTDIELANFDLLPDVSIGASVTPQFVIYNNSDLVVNSAVLHVEITGAGGDFAIQDSLPVIRSINPHSELVIAYDDPDYQEHAVQLPAYATQLKVRANLNTEYTETDTVFNNTVTRYYDLFDRNLPVKLVENFLRYSESSNLLLSQDAAALDDLTFLNYFPLVADTNYAIGATQRFNWYGLMGLPMTVLGGDSLITGYIANLYGDQFNLAAQGLQEQTTFLMQSSATLSLSEPFINLQMRLVLRNIETYLFDNGIDPNPMRTSRFFAALVNKRNLQGRERYVFARWGAYADTIGTSLQFGESWQKQISIPVNNIPQDSLESNYVLLYWLQNNSSKQIIFANLVPIAGVTHSSEELVPSALTSLVLAPNPIRKGDKLHLSLDSALKGNAQYSIYNTRGRLVTSGILTLTEGKATMQNDKLTTSGIYFLKLSLPGQNPTSTPQIQTAKFIFIR